MATILWGKVYFRDSYAGELRQEPDGRCTFTYDHIYLESGKPAIAYTLPLRSDAYVSEGGLHPFFDNLVAEGWLRNAQARALSVNADNRFALLLAFGRDCAGAVSVIDPAPVHEPLIEMGDPESIAALASRASLSGIQPKLLAVKEDRGYRPARVGETSTHIAKLPSGSLRDIIEIEYITTAAVKALLLRDSIVDLDIAPLAEVADKALLVPRFDRTRTGQKLHFEEFNQLLGKASGDPKYDAAYEDMARFILETPGCIPAEVERLFRRVLACFLTGNTDAHLKNFAMMHGPEGLRLAPAYDLVASALYREYQTLALSVGGARNLKVGDLKPKHIVALGEGFGLGAGVIRAAVEDFDKRLPTAIRAVEKAANLDAARSKELIERMEKRWNGTFASIGTLLSKKPSGGAKRSV